MAGENELLEAEGITSTHTEVEQNQPTHDLQIEDKGTGVDSLDKRLEELANGTSRGNEAKKVASTETKVQTKPATNAADKGTQEQQQAQLQPQRSSVIVGGYAGKAPRAYGQRFNWDAQGNVIDKTTGGVIAAAGSDRKAFERMLPIINSSAVEADKFKTAYEGAIKANTIATSLNLTPEEYSIGARIMAQWKSDPKKALDFMIKEAQNNGVDVSDLGVRGGGGATAQQIQTALEEVVKKHLEPFSFITSERQEQQQYREALTAADQSINEFYTSYPDAKVHEDSLAKIMSARQGTSLETAYLILKNSALEQKLDWTKDLVPQIQALMGKQPQPNSNGQPANTQRTLPNMNGRVGSTAIIPRKAGPMAGTVSSKDIVLEAMRNAGMDVSDI